MYCNSCGNKVPDGSKTCPTCGIEMRYVNNGISKELKEEIKEELKRTAFEENSYAPSKARITSTEYTWDLGLHNLVAKYLIWLISLVNLFWGLFFTFGTIEFKESKVACFLPAYSEGIILQVMGVVEEHQYPITVCFRVYGVVLIVAALAILLTLSPMQNKSENAPQGFISVLECLVATKFLAGIVASLLTTNPLWLLSMTLFMAALNVVYLIVFIPYYRERKHLFRN